jgi:hypothetical protein
MDLGFYFPEKNGLKKQKPQHKTVLRLFGVVPHGLEPWTY